MVMSPWLPVSLSSSTEVVLFGIAFFGWAASEIIGSIILPRLRHRRDGIQLERKDQGSGLAVNIGIIASVYIAFGFSLVRIAVLPDWVFYPGLHSCSEGSSPAVVHRDTRRILLRAGKRPGRADHNIRKGHTGSSATRHTRDTPDTDRDRTCRPVVGSVTHPGGNVWHRVQVRIGVEEKALVEQFGNEYAAYMNTTKMLIPFIL